ncbi:hypothetical protein M9H77_28706 [Catharanthus roseus]|uniref:Uncharacterized protein n=1 Tax=Catharanthus roseus TaxID=4058 RepID=A0ACC0AIT9_CATRO|nr:hypothetical protein M9H77_28706 [Catharanthus roseus]
MVVVAVSTKSTGTWRPFLLRPFRRLRCCQTSFSFSSTASSAKVSSYLDEDCGEFLPWLERKAGTEISSVLRIGKSACGRFESWECRALYTSKSVQAGDCLLRVPYKVQLAPDNLPSEIFSLLRDEVSNITMVAVLLLYEQKLNQKSEWALYVSSLPRPSEMHNTIFWSDDELEMIRQSSVYEETIKQRNVIEKEFLAIKPILDRFPKHFQDVTLKDFRHAYALVTSRAWESTRGVSMIPFADFLNHDGRSESYVLSDEGKQVSEVIADRDHGPGDQVQIRYGKFSNGTLLLDFGFTEPYNIYDQVQVELNIPHDDNLREMKSELLHRYRAPVIKDVSDPGPVKNFFTIKEVKSVSANRKGRGIPQSFRAFARVLCSKSPQELKDLVMEAEQNDGRLARRPLENRSREMEAHQLMLSKITQLIKEYDASIKYPGKPPISCCITKKCALRMQMARDLLDGELRVLKSASAWLKYYCASLVEG